jgi:hypothetical protein
MRKEYPACADMSISFGGGEGCFLSHAVTRFLSRLSLMAAVLPANPPTQDQCHGPRGPWHQKTALLFCLYKPSKTGSTSFAHGVANPTAPIGWQTRFPWSTTAATSQSSVQGAPDSCDYRCPRSSSGSLTVRGRSLLLAGRLLLLGLLIEPLGFLIRNLVRNILEFPGRNTSLFHQLGYPFLQLLRGLKTRD